MKHLLLFTFIFSLGLISSANAQEVISLSPKNPQPGDAVLVKLAPETRVATSSFNGRPAYFLTWKGAPHLAFGVPVTQTSGIYDLIIVLENGRTITHKVEVMKRSFPKIVLGIPEKLNMTQEALNQKIATEKKNLESLFTTSSVNLLFSKPFGLPLYDNRKQSSPYGEIRQTGNATSRHLGVDFVAREGRPVAAVNDGRVVKAYTDTVYGNCVIIDHGGYIFSLYLHLQEMKVRTGDIIKQGQVIGRVGQTGYATGPHLHLTIRVGGVPVDPLHFLRDFK